MASVVGDSQIAVPQLLRQPGLPTTATLAASPVRRRLRPGRAFLSGWLLAALAPMLSAALPAASAQAPAAPALDEQLTALEAFRAVTTEGLAEPSWLLGERSQTRAPGEDSAAVSGVSTPKKPSL